MTACELCWAQAFWESQSGPESQAETYRRILAENEDKPGHADVTESHGIQTEI